MVVGEIPLCPSFLICYASQKGTAQSIAEEISEQSIAHDLGSACNLSCISEIKNLNKFRNFLCIIFVGSTTGDGEPPDTAQKFMEMLKKEVAAETSLSWLNYTILGLGDTNYTNFCNFGKTLDKHLQNTKAQRFYDCGWADDGTGLEVVVDSWIEGLFPVLKTFLNSSNAWRTLMKKQSDSIEISEEKAFFEEESSDDQEAMSGHIDAKDESDCNSVMSRSSDLSTCFPKLNIITKDEITKNGVRTCRFSTEDQLSLPVTPSPFLLIEFNDRKIEKHHWDVNDSKETVSYPLARSQVIHCQIASCRRLTKPDAKRTLEISLKACSGEHFEYEPGDSFGIVVENRTVEVNTLLYILKVADEADFEIKLSVDPNTKKKVASIPKFIPRECTLRYIFTRCLDIRSIPKKPFLRALIEHTQDPSERRRLMEFVSKEGGDEYNRIVRLQGLTFLDLLILFPSCSPPASLVLEHLPRLLPRPYSITSSPLITPNLLSFAFNVIEIPMGEAVAFRREGLCTGWLDSLTKELQLQPENKDTLSFQMKNLLLETRNEVLIYFRNNQTFRLPKEIDTPLIMIGPGTGVAPFIGFLKHREAQFKSGVSDKVPFTWLFFGCRHKDRDFLYEEELKVLIEAQILTQLSVSFSRDEKEEGDPKYVQDNLVLRAKKVIDYINNQNASVYVCGDARNMSKNVFDTFVTLLQNHLQMTEIDARRYIVQMQMNQRYLQDVWA